MYSIGEFSKINRITAKTLRHYDSIGLLKPAKTDDWTGYRFYTAEQLPVIRHIITLKDLGFSLIEIGEMIQNQNHIAELLKKRKQEITEAIESEKNRLIKVEKYLVQLEGEQIMKTKVIIKELPEVIVASMRTVVPSYDTFFDIVPKMGEYMKSAGAVCRVPEYCFNIYHDGEYRESNIDVEICEAVVEAKNDSEKVKFKKIEGIREAACIQHKGPYSTLRDSYNLVFQWIEGSGYKVNGHPRESYIDGIWNKEDPSEWLTEIQVPVKK